MNVKTTIAALTLFALSLGVCLVAGCGLDGKPTIDPQRPVLDGSTHASAPELTGVTEWINSKPLTLAGQRGKVVVVHFWTNGCINCIHNYPHYRAWQEKYQDKKDFLILGIHTPEFDSERDVDRIKDRLAKNHLTFPVAVDNDRANWEAWGNQFWPALYLVDKTGHIRHRWEGELGEDGYKKVTQLIDELLDE
jgi:thiol-disulfide isomerase/thioredoxin